MRAKVVSQLELSVSAAVGLLVGGLLTGLHAYIGRIFSGDPRVWEATSRIAFLVGPAYALMALFYTVGCPCFFSLIGVATAALL